MTIFIFFVQNLLHYVATSIFLQNKKMKHKTRAESPLITYSFYFQHSFFLQFFDLRFVYLIILNFKSIFWRRIKAFESSTRCQPPGEFSIGGLKSQYSEITCLGVRKRTNSIPQTFTVLERTSHSGSDRFWLAGQGSPLLWLHLGHRDIEHLSLDPVFPGRRTSSLLGEGTSKKSHVTGCSCSNCGVRGAAIQGSSMELCNRAQCCYWRVRARTTPKQQQRKQNLNKGLKPTKDAWVSSRGGRVSHRHTESEVEQSAKKRAQVLLRSFQEAAELSRGAKVRVGGALPRPIWELGKWRHKSCRFLSCAKRNEGRNKDGDSFFSGWGCYNAL